MKKTEATQNPLVPKRRRVKCSRGEPVLYSELKQPRSLALTNTAIVSAKHFGDICGTTSTSESVEMALRLVGRLQTSLLLEELRLMVADLSTEGAHEETEEVSQ